MKHFKQERLTIQSDKWSSYLLSWSHLIVFPILLGFLFDLPLLNQSIIVLVLITAVYLSGDIVEAILLLWHSLALSALIFITLKFTFNISFLNYVSVVVILLFWFGFLLRKFKSERLLRHKRFQSIDLDELLIFVFLYVIAPRGRLDNLDFIYQEDNQRSLNSIVRALRTSHTDLSLLNSSDTLGMPPFVKFFSNFVAKVGFFTIDEIPLRAINVLSNCWIFLLFTYFLFGISFIRSVLARLDIRVSIFVRSFSLMTMFWGFEVSHSAGYFPLFLLNTVVIVFLYTFRDVSSTLVFDRIVLFFIGLSLSLAMFGSWQPWIPVAGGAVIVVIYKVLGRIFFNRVFSSHAVKLATFLLTIWFLWNLVKRLTNIDLESSGRDHFPTEVLLILTIFFVIIAASLYDLITKSEKNYLHHAKNFSVTVFTCCAASVVVVFIYVLDLSPNQSRTLFILVFIGLIFNRSGIREVRSSSFSLLSNETRDGPILLAVISFLYVGLIFILSRLIGPTYEPMYASDKASVAFYSQFYWLPITFLASKNNGKEKFSLLREAISLVAISGLLSIPSSLWYDPTQEKWWHKPVVESLALNPELPIVCSFTTEFSKDRETWVCTHFMEVLNEEKFIDLLWFQQWQSIGPRAVDLTIARRYLVEEAKFQHLLVLSCTSLSQEMLDFFSVIESSRISLKTYGPCDT